MLTVVRKPQDVAINPMPLICMNCRLLTTGAPLCPFLVGATLPDQFSSLCEGSVIIGMVGHLGDYLLIPDHICRVNHEN